MPNTDTPMVSAKDYVLSEFAAAKKRPIPQSVRHTVLSDFAAAAQRPSPQPDPPTAVAPATSSLPRPAPSDQVENFRAGEREELRSTARQVVQVTEWLSRLTLIGGGLAALIIFLTMLTTTPTGGLALLSALLGMALIALSTAIAWTSIALAKIVALYVIGRTDT